MLRGCKSFNYTAVFLRTVQGTEKNNAYHQVPCRGREDNFFRPKVVYPSDFPGESSTLPKIDQNCSSLICQRKSHIQDLF